MAFLKNIFKRSPTNRSPAARLPTNSAEPTTTSPTSQVSKTVEGITPVALVTAGSVAPSTTVSIVYGTFKGSTKAFAETLSSRLSGSGVRVDVTHVASTEPEKIIKSDYTIFLVPTYILGAVTPDTKPFMTWLESQDAGSLAGRFVAVCGFGVAALPTYCKASKKVEEMLVKKGARVIVERLSVDRQNNEVFNKWINGKLLPYIQKELPTQFFAGGSRPSTPSTSPGSADLGDHVGVHFGINADALLLDHPDIKSSSPDPQSQSLFDMTSFDLVESKQLCPEPNESEGMWTYHVKLELPTDICGYKTASDVSILPENDPALVDWMFNFLDTTEEIVSSGSISLDTVFIEALTANTVRLPSPCTVRKALTQYLDLNHLGGKEWMLSILAYIPDDNERIALIELCKDEKDDMYTQCIVTPKMSLKEFFSLLVPSIKLPLSVFIHSCPLQSYRTYSISTSCVDEARNPGFAVSLHREILPELPREALKTVGFPLLGAIDTNRVYLGVCSSFLCNRPGKSALCKLSDSSFVVQADCARPLVLVGGGSGLGPMRAFWREYSNCHTAGGSPAALHVFFGGKSSKAWIYRDEMAAHAETEHLPEGVLIAEPHPWRFESTGLAFSRDQTEKIYIDTPLKIFEDAIWSCIVDQQGQMVVCGSAGFVETVNKFIAQMGESRGEDKAAVVGKWIETGRLVVEEFG